MDNDAWIAVTLREWFESQRLELAPHRAAFLSAMQRGDINALRNLLREADFSDEQRKYLDDLLGRWERSLLARGKQTE